MFRKHVALICLSLLLVVGCTKKAAHLESFIGSSDKQTIGMAMMLPVADAAQRYVAVRHKLVLMAPGAKLSKALESLIAFCGTIQCEIVSSSEVAETQNSAPSGNLSVRVAPEDLNKFLDYAAKLGKVTQHNTESEDKTAIAVDTDAKLKNLTEFRDNLRKMLAKPTARVTDLVEIQEKLSEVQAQLDSQAMQRKILANETEKVAVEFSLLPEDARRRGSIFSPIGDALSESGSVLAESLAALITAVAAIIPWLIVIIPGGRLLVRAWRRRRKQPQMPAAG